MTGPVTISTMMRLNCLAALVVCAWGWPAQAEIYKSVDAEGRITYSNIPTKGAKKLNLEPMGTVSGRRGGGGSRYASAAPANFPSVDDQTQRMRDMNRRAILEKELADEQALLAQARQALTEAESSRSVRGKGASKSLEYTQPFRETVTLHEKNIEALQRELASAQ
jgi:hypothetical protein